MIKIHALFAMLVKTLTGFSGLSARGAAQYGTQLPLLLLYCIITITIMYCFSCLKTDLRKGCRV